MFELLGFGLGFELWEFFCGWRGGWRGGWRDGWWVDEWFGGDGWTDGMELLMGNGTGDVIVEAGGKERIQKIWTSNCLEVVLIVH